ncbi:hypothetical protein KJY73_06495 [Bowmanella sp. Y26]|uniref:hypothetical protein n=1 Tax=Bowmanella yangjiangensis TaxID=2811230 RepID=UPI001BDD644F|nr:hypothetical protein [Bowmanella yangjiangensis]MBT1063215.1 hypothetical protein [Bowmanella yangjiangensis]
MLDKLRVVAIRLRWLRPFLSLVGLMSLAVFIYVLLLSGSSSQDSLLIPSILTLLWSGISYWFITAFTRLPRRPSPRQSWSVRMKIRFIRGFYLLLMLTAACLTMVVVFISIRGINLWLQS